MKEKLNKILDKINHQLCKLKKTPVELVMENDFENADGYLNLFGRKRSFGYKKNLRLPQIHLLQRNTPSNNTILLTDYLQPTVADALLEDGIEYADMAGNLFLRDKNNIILIQNCQKTPELAMQENLGRAFTSTGVKILFLLLTEPEALSWSYRMINTYSGVSMGSIKYVMADLKAQNLMVPVQGKFYIPDYPRLLERWTNAYLGHLYCKHETESYEGDITTSLDNYPVSLTGETAAAELHLMKAAQTTMYRWGNINELVLRNRLKKSPDGNIKIRKAFWPEARTLKPLVPYLLIYADLLAEGDNRCTEVAKIIYEQHLCKEAQ